MDKLKATIVHITRNCDPDNLGQTKLHKALYYSDMLNYISTGDSITGSEYKKRPHGPTCEALLIALDEMQREGTLSITEVDYFGFRKKQFKCLHDCDSNWLSDAEIIVLDEVIEFVCRNNSARTISEFSHSAGWDMVEFGEVIPYHTAISWVPSEVTQEAVEWSKSAKAELADEGVGSRTEGLGGSDSAAFRARLVELRQLRSSQA